MTDPTHAALLALAERCEQATGPDRELDARIYILTAGGSAADADYAATDPDVTCKPPRFTAFLDAALSLVPEGWHVALDPVFWIDGERVAYDAFCIKPMWEKWRPHEAEVWLPRVKARHAEKPLAAVAAALRALASGAPR